MIAAVPRRETNRSSPIMHELASKDGKISTWTARVVKHVKMPDNSAKNKNNFVKIEKLDKMLLDKSCLEHLNRVEAPPPFSANLCKKIGEYGEID